MPDVHVLHIADQVVIEVTAAEAVVLDQGWRHRWAAAGRTALAPWCSTAPGYASARVDTARADELLALAEEARGPVPARLDGAED